MKDSKTFDSDRKGTGTMEWADHTENICIGCHNDCIYCYAAYNADKNGTKPRNEWSIETISKRGNATSYNHKDGVIMFPTTHDITEYNVDKCISFLKLVLKANNKVLIVSKPNPRCIKKMIKELEEYKDNIMFRFTIGTPVNRFLKVFEPNAPSYREREKALKMAFKAGFRTSISMEPLLCSITSAIRMITELQPYVTDSFWIGKLNKADMRVDKNRLTEKVKLALDTVINWQDSDESMIWFMDKIKTCSDIDQKKIMWKDSMKEVIERSTK